MNYDFLRDLLSLAEEYDSSVKGDGKSLTTEGFKKWLTNPKDMLLPHDTEPEWEGKENGRSPESIINTLIVHLGRYAKTYAKAAMHESPFAAQEDFIYLINLEASGPMTKMELIRKNVQNKTLGMQVINRLLRNEWIVQRPSYADKRSKILEITDNGAKILNAHMEKIRTASRIVTGNLTYDEKIELIRLLMKLEDFHLPIYMENLPINQLLSSVVNEHKFLN